MNVADLCKGLFELGAGGVILLNVRQVLRDRSVWGVHWWPSAYFVMEGIYNGFYFPLLGQWLAFCGNAGVTLANVWYVALLIRYSRKKDPSC